MPNWKIINEILRLAIPTVGEMILYMMIWIFDTTMVGKYGGQLAVSSVGLCTQIIYSFFDLVNWEILSQGWWPIIRYHLSRTYIRSTLSVPGLKLNMNKSAGQF